jgi:hypothetical protein
MDQDKYELKKMTKLELLGWIAGWKTTTEQYLVGMEELRHRNESQNRELAWWAIVISSLSLIVAVISLFLNA